MVTQYVIFSFSTEGFDLHIFDQFDNIWHSVFDPNIELVEV
jgi:hypothetical protein